MYVLLLLCVSVFWGERGEGGGGVERGDECTCYAVKKNGADKVVDGQRG